MNKVFLIGRLTKDPDMNFQANTGKAITKITLAVNRYGKKDECDFINCVAFGKTAEIIGEHTTKGSQIAVFGSIKTGKYTTKDNITKYTTDILVSEMQFLDKSKNNAHASNNADNGNDDLDYIPGDIPY